MRPWNLPLPPKKLRSCCSNPRCVQCTPLAPATAPRKGHHCLHSKTTARRAMCPLGGMAPQSHRPMPPSGRGTVLPLCTVVLTGLPRRCFISPPRNRKASTTLRPEVLPLSLMGDLGSPLTAEISHHWDRHASPSWRLPAPFVQTNLPRWTPPHNPLGPWHRTGRDVEPGGGNAWTSGLSAITPCGLPPWGTDQTLPRESHE